MPFCTCPNCGHHFLSDPTPALYPRGKAERILQLCADHFSITLKILRARTKQTEQVKAMHCARYLIYRYCHLSLKDIGGLWDDPRDHTTILRSIRLVQNALRSRDYVSEDIAALQRVLDREFLPPPADVVPVLQKVS